MSRTPLPILLAAVLACGGGGDGGTTPAAVASITLTPANDTSLLVGQMLSVSAVPRDAQGSPLTGRQISWTSSSVGTVQLSATTGGTIVASALAAGSSTVAASSEGRSADLLITVTANAVPVASVTIAPGHDTTLTQGASRSFTATTRDAGGNVITGRTIAWSSTNSSVVTVSPSSGASTTASTVAAGTARVVAASEGKADTVTLTVQAASFPSSATVNMTGTSFSPSTVDIAAGGTVTWTNGSGLTHNVTFDNPSAVTGGNIGNHSSGSNTRTFPTAGSHPYQCTLHAGMTGTVVVH